MSPPSDLGARRAGALFLLSDEASRWQGRCFPTSEWEPPNSLSLHTVPFRSKGNMSARPVCVSVPRCFHSRLWKTHAEEGGRGAGSSLSPLPGPGLQPLRSTGQPLSKSELSGKRSQVHGDSQTPPSLLHVGSQSPPSRRHSTPWATQRVHPVGPAQV